MAIVIFFGAFNFLQSTMCHAACKKKKKDKKQMKTLRLKCYLMECKQHVLDVKDLNVTVNNKNQHECFLEQYFTLM